MDKRIAFLAALLCGMVLNASKASAVFITFDYIASRLGGSVAGTFGYDTTGPQVFAFGTQAGYNTGFITGTITGGPQDGGTFNLNSGLTIIDNGLAFDQLSVSATVPTDVTVSFPAATFPSTALPLSFDLTAFPLQNGEVNIGSADLATVAGIDVLTYEITSLSLASSAVPEPSSLILFGVGGVVILRRRTRIRQQCG